nr:major head protein [uncultured Mediterranean phage uvMED]|tara:strand:+ start:2807 stop:3772 length:966 start_codon:yes stop_codon:yes gene_type:complete
MAQPSNMFDTFETVGLREDLADVIYNIAPEDTPILSAIPRTKATSTKHEWQTDTLADAAANAVIEGDDATTDALAATARVHNFTQIMDKVILLSGTQSAVDAAGRADEMAYQIAKKSKELKKDMEFALIKENLSVVGTASAARELGSISTWIATNGSAGASGGALSAGFNAATGLTRATTGGTDRNITEDILKSVIKDVYEAGGDLDMFVVPPSVKQTVSTFNANTTRFGPAGERVEYAAIDVYSSDFGDIQVVPNRIMALTNEKMCFLLQRDMLAAAYLRDFSINELAKTGDSERVQLLVEWTLEMRNEKAHGILLDINQ